MKHCKFVFVQEKVKRGKAAGKVKRGKAAGEVQDARNQQAKSLNLPATRNDEATRVEKYLNMELCRTIVEVSMTVALWFFMKDVNISVNHFLFIFQVPPSSPGNCMFDSVVDQLQNRGCPVSGLPLH